MKYMSYIWSLILAVAPIIISLTCKLLEEFLATKNAATQAKVRTIMSDLVCAAQKLFPDEDKRKAWVLTEFQRYCPNVPQEYASALVESVLISLKKEYANWSSEAPTSSTSVPATSVGTVHIEVSTVDPKV